MHHFDNSILEENYPVEKKINLIKLFEICYEFLSYFTAKNKEN